MPPARATWLGAVMTAVLVAGGVGYAAVATGTVRIALVMGTFGVAVAAAIAFRRTPSAAGQAAAALLVPVAAIVETVGVGLVLSRGPGVGAFSEAGVLGVLLALIPFAVPLSVGLAAMVGALGVVASLRTEIDADGTAQVVGTTLLTMVLLGLVFGASVALRVVTGEAVVSEWLEVAAETGSAAVSVIGPPDPRVGLLIFCLLLAAAGMSGFQAVRAVPVSDLAPSRHRDRIDRIASALKRLFGWSAVGGVFGTVVVVMAADVGAIEPAIAADPVVRTVVRFLGSDGLQWLLVGLTGAFVAVTLTIALLQRMTGGVASLLGRLVPASAGALAVVGLAVTAGPRALSELQARMEPTTEPVAQLFRLATPGELVLVGAGLALAVFAATLVGLIVVGVLGLVPNRTLGGVLAGSGLGLGAVALALHGGPPIAVFGVLGLGVVSWDATDRSVRAVADLHGRRGPSMAVELLHWGTSGGVATVGIAAAVGLMAVVQGARAGPLSEYALAALAVVAVAIVVLVGVIRG